MAGEMNYATVCSGIGAPEVAWRELWGAPEFTSEIEPFPSAVLKHHMPDIPNYGDMTKYKEWPNHELGLICGGTPCQSFSVAGLRKGMDDPRGNLTLTFLGLLARYNPRWFVWENVPGVLSSGGGRDFAGFLRGLQELGYSCAYRVLDAQYFGVPQRRRRVFVVGHLGADWRPPFAVLTEPESMRGHTPTGRKAGEKVARGLAIGIDEECNASIDKYGPLLRGGQGGTRQSVMTVHARQDPITVEDAALPLEAKGGEQAIAFRACGQESFNPAAVTPPICSSDGGGAGPPTVCISGRTRGDDGRGYSRPEHITEDISQCLDTAKPHVVAFDTTQITSPLNYSNPKPGDPCHPLASTAHIPSIINNTIVRRLTPMECERLQGFPDNYTRIAWRGKGPELCPDGPRYKALGNSMAVPVVRWIGERIQLYESLRLT